MGSLYVKEGRNHGDSQFSARGRVRFREMDVTFREGLSGFSFSVIFRRKFLSRGKNRFAGTIQDACPSEMMGVCQGLKPYLYIRDVFRAARITEVGYRESPQCTVIRKTSSLLMELVPPCRDENGLLGGNPHKIHFSCELLPLKLQMVMVIPDSAHKNGEKDGTRQES